MTQFLRPFTESGVDFTLVTSPARIGPKGDNDSVIVAYKGLDDIAADISFGRQLVTGGTSDDLPPGAGEIVDSSLGCLVRLIGLSDQGGLDRTGVFYSEASKTGVATTRIQTVILPKDGKINFNILPSVLGCSVLFLIFEDDGIFLSQM